MLAVLIGVAVLAFGLYDYSSFLLANPDYITVAPPFYFNAYDAFLWSLDLFSLVAPVLAVLPFADSLAQDVRSGYARSVLIRASYKRYMLAKVVAGALAGGMAIGLALVLLFICTNLLFPRGMNMAPYTRRISLDGKDLSAFGYLYHSQPDLYIAARIGLGALFGMTYALLGLAISAVTTSRYIVLAMPLVLFFVAQLVIALLGIPKWLPTNAIAPLTVQNVTAVHVFTVLGITAGVALGMLLMFIPRVRARI